MPPARRQAHGLPQGPSPAVPLQLTDAGRTFLRGARLTPREAEHAARSARHASLGEIGHLRLGFVDSAIYTYLPGLLSEFRARYPDVDVELIELPSRAQPNALIDDRVDVNLVREPIASEEVVVLVLSTGAPAGRDEITLAELVDEPLILFDRPNDPRTHDRLVPLLQDAGSGRARRLGSLGGVSTITRLIGVSAQLAGILRRGQSDRCPFSPGGGAVRTTVLYAERWVAAQRARTLPFS
jgi:DNA-binding transcriptional LysR family regulator